MRYTAGNTHIEDGVRTIPCDPHNADYQDILRRIRDEGLAIDPYVPPPDPTPAERRAVKYAQRVDQWSLSIVRYQARLTDPLLTAQQKAKIQTKLDASIAKVQQLSTQIEQEDPDNP